MKTALRIIATALAALTLATGTARAYGPAGWRGGATQFHGYHAVGPHWRGHGFYGPRYGYWRPGFWGGVGIGIGVGAAGYYYGAPWYPGYVVVAPPPYAYYEAAPVTSRAPAVKGPPDPIIYPKNGQSTAQTEADRQQCNRWATTQPSALADASVFHRATIACMEGRGYTVR